MHSANSTTMWLRRISGVFFSVLFSFFAQAQDNSPYSRYGIGDVVPNHNISNRAMGGISAGYSIDSATPAIPVSSLNIANPAALGSFSKRSYINVMFDVGAEVDRRTLKSNLSPQKYTSNNTNISYLQLGFPIASRKMEEKGIQWGVSFGLKPVTRINYRISEDKRLANIDTVRYIYEGNGGISQANISTGIRIKNFSFGISTGYSFGSKDYSTKLQFLNDTVVYYSSNAGTLTQFGGIFFTVGTQYRIPTKKGYLQLGAYANLTQNLSAKRDSIDETFAYDFNGGTYTIDTVAYAAAIPGKIKVPASYSLGFVYSNSHWLVGADLDIANWSAYRYYKEKDPSVKNNWTFRMGAQYFPQKGRIIKSYWDVVKYRAGLYLGPDYINLSKKRNEYGLSFGAGLPLTNSQRMEYGGEFVTLNAGLELGLRGDKDTRSFRENMARFSIGVSMGQRWFQKRKYD